MGHGSQFANLPMSSTHLVACRNLAARHDMSPGFQGAILIEGARSIGRLGARGTKALPAARDPGTQGGSSGLVPRRPRHPGPSMAMIPRSSRFGTHTGPMVARPIGSVTGLMPGQSHRQDVRILMPYRFRGDWMNLEPWCPATEVRRAAMTPGRAETSTPHRSWSPVPRSTWGAGHLVVLANGRHRRRGVKAPRGPGAWTPIPPMDQAASRDDPPCRRHRQVAWNTGPFHTLVADAA